MAAAENFYIFFRQVVVFNYFGADCVVNIVVEIRKTVGIFDDFCIKNYGL